MVTQWDWRVSSLNVWPGEWRRETLRIMNIPSSNDQHSYGKLSLNSWLSHEEKSFPIAMLNYQMVYIWDDPGPTDMYQNSSSRETTKKRLNKQQLLVAILATGPGRRSDKHIIMFMAKIANSSIEKRKPTPMLIASNHVQIHANAQLCWKSTLVVSLFYPHFQSNSKTSTAPAGPNITLQSPKTPGDLTLLHGGDLSKVQKTKIHLFLCSLTYGAPYVEHQ